MFTLERQDRILEMLQGKGSVSVPNLSRQFNCSESTIRRDLAELESQKRLKRTHGGAVAINSDHVELPFFDKKEKHRREKQAIAAEAIRHIQEGDTILIDGGTTNHALASHVARMRNITVVTNSLMVGYEFADCRTVNSIMTGGRLRIPSLTLVGPLVEQSIRDIKVDKLFLGIDGLTLEAGMSTTGVAEAEAKRLFISRAKRVIVLADHSKLGGESFATIGPVDLMQMLITTRQADENVIVALRERGIEIVQV